MVEQDNFEAKKTHYFVATGLRVRGALELHRDAGLWDKIPVEGQTKLKRDWGNASEHMLVQVARSRALGCLLNLPENLIADMEIASALHDVEKKTEVVLFNRSIKEGTSSWDAYEESSLRAEERMRDAVYRPDIITLAGATGHSGLHESLQILKKPRLSPFDSAFLAVHYIDDISNGSHWVRLPTEENGKRINEVDMRLNDGEKNPRYQKLNEEGKAHFNGETTWDAERRVAHLIEQRFVARISENVGYAVDPLSLPELIDEAVRQDIQAFTIGPSYSETRHYRK